MSGNKKRATSAYSGKKDSGKKRKDSGKAVAAVADEGESQQTVEGAAADAQRQN